MIWLQVTYATRTRFYLWDVATRGSRYTIRIHLDLITRTYSLRLGHLNIALDHQVALNLYQQLFRGRRDRSNFLSQDLD